MRIRAFLKAIGLLSILVMGTAAILVLAYIGVWLALGAVGLFLFWLFYGYYRDVELRRRRNEKSD